MESGFVAGLMEFAGEGGNHSAPVEGFGGASSGGADGVPVGARFEGGVELREKLVGLVEGSEVTVHGVPDMLLGGGVVVGEGDELGGECFDDDVSKGFGDAGEDKEVAGGVVAGEVLAFLHPGKDELGVLFLELLAFGAIADKDAGGVGLVSPDAGKCFEGEGDVFLGGDPAHEDSGDSGFGIDSPGSAQTGIALGWMEQVGIDPATEEAQVLNPEGFESLDDLSGGSEGAAGAVMGAAEKCADECFE